MWFYKNHENSNDKNQQVSILSDWQRKKKHNKIFGEEILSCTVYGMKVGNNFWGQFGNIHQI